MEELFKLVREFNDKYFPDWKDTMDVYLSNAIAGEVGELCNAVKHFHGGGSKGKIVSDKEIFLVECADIFIYMSLFLMKHDIDSERFKELIKDKIKENIKRFERRK